MLRGPFLRHARASTEGGSDRRPFPPFPFSASCGSGASLARVLFRPSLPFAVRSMRHGSALLSPRRKSAPGFADDATVFRAVAASGRRSPDRCGRAARPSRAGPRCALTRHRRSCARGGGARVPRRGHTALPASAHGGDEGADARGGTAERRNGAAVSFARPQQRPRRRAAAAARRRMGLFLSRRAVGYFPLLLRGCAIRLSTLARQSLEIWNGEEKRKPLVNAQTYGNDRNDHTMLTAPLPVCSAKLSSIGPS
jgi:hypothetical protein